MVTALGSAVFHIYKPENSSEWQHRLIYEESPKQVKNWQLPEMPALATDMLISMDDRFLFVPFWLHGKVNKRCAVEKNSIDVSKLLQIICFDISDPHNIKQASKVC